MRTIDPINDRPDPPPRTACRIQNGIRHNRINSANTTRVRAQSEPGTAAPNRPPATPSGVRNTLTVTARVRLCATWMARQPANARHHQRAMPSVCGRACSINASGAPGDQDDRDRHPHHVDQQQHLQDRGRDQADDQQSGARHRPRCGGGQRAADQLPQRGRAVGRVDAVGEHRGREGVGEFDRDPRPHQRQRPGQEPGDHAGGDLAQPVAGLHALIAHHEHPAEQDQHRVAAQQDLPRGVPQPGQARDLLRRRGGQQGVGQQLQAGVEQISDQALQELVDRGGHAARQIPRRTTRAAPPRLGSFPRRGATGGARSRALPGRRGAVESATRRTCCPRRRPRRRSTTSVTVVGADGVGVAAAARVMALEAGCRSDHGGTPTPAGGTADTATAGCADRGGHPDTGMLDRGGRSGAVLGSGAGPVVDDASAAPPRTTPTRTTPTVRTSPNAQNRREGRTGGNRTGGPQRCRGGEVRGGCRNGGCGSGGGHGCQAPTICLRTVTTSGASSARA